MIPKRFIARATAVAGVLAFIAIGSIGVHHNTGDWATVAVFWACMVGIAAAICAVSWALDNWNAR
ncbi:hypothetical protein ACFWNR_06275 [Streptomyces virginiae]|uniref:hypothetical protein n=1 Tax=Streptomyces virginiae TaxID=1961 RepID=UPI00364A7091